MNKEEAISAINDALSNIVPKGEIKSYLVENGMNQQEAKMLVADCFSKIDLKTWRRYLLKNPFGTDFIGLILVLLTLAGAVGFGIIGFSYFPPGSYPRIVAAIPGLLAGALIFYLLSPVFHKLRKA